MQGAVGDLRQHVSLTPGQGRGVALGILLSCNAMSEVVHVSVNVGPYAQLISLVAQSIVLLDLLSPWLLMRFN